MAEHCNGKIVGARYFADTWLAGGGSVPEGEVLSPRDMAGHGTHTASTAAGLALPNVTIDGRGSSVPSPGWRRTPRSPSTRCSGAAWAIDADIIAGIDAAVADGVQVLNFSIGSELGDWEANTPIGVAFLNASLAGVFVAASAGNTGIVSGAISNAAPWVTTVGAAVTKLDEATAKLGDGTKLVGGSLDALPGGDARPMVFGEQAGSPDRGAVYCEPGSLDPAKIKGKVVACALSDMFGSAAEIKAKGGAAMVVFDPVGNYRINSIFNFPVVYLPTEKQAGTLFNYLMRHPTDATVSLRTGGDGSSVPGIPSVADFSSTGPDKVTLGVFKAGPCRAGVEHHRRGLTGGQLRATVRRVLRHLDGLAVRGRRGGDPARHHPDWSPGAVASALRTTATDTVGTSTPWSRAAVHQPARGHRPGSGHRADGGGTGRVQRDGAARRQGTQPAGHLVARVRRHPPGDPHPHPDQCGQGAGDLPLVGFRPARHEGHRVAGIGDAGPRQVQDGHHHPASGQRTLGPVRDRVDHLARQCPHARIPVAARPWGSHPARTPTTVRNSPG